ncbi:hypothetical protein [Vibrio misgurnus]|uniref:hypothetical protein n=1 Tax=Vibrio misgurnus TaxID=2993714 RepID=UPI00241730BB|nr:hypothetical protein [Vibrio sp. gvc]
MTTDTTASTLDPFIFDLEDYIEDVSNCLFVNSLACYLHEKFRDVAVPISDGHEIELGCYSCSESARCMSCLLVDKHVYLAERLRLLAEAEAHHAATFAIVEHCRFARSLKTDLMLAAMGFHS